MKSQFYKTQFLEISLAKKNPIAEAEIKSIIHFLKPNKNHQVMMK
jgi:hypothetical protein